MLEFFKDIVKVIAGALVQVLIAFAVGTGAGALICWYYGLPIILSLIGGIVVLGIYLALISDSPFS